VHQIIFASPVRFLFMHRRVMKLCIYYAHGLTLLMILTNHTQW